MLKKILTATITSATILAIAAPALAAGKTSTVKSVRTNKYTYTAPTLTTQEQTTIPWGTTIFDGYGSVTWNPSLGRLTMSPKAATQPSETHSALVVSTQQLKQPYQLSYAMKTVQQLRTGSAPNPWETGWVVFGYKPDGKFKYVILKPNGYGVEMGESLLNDAQNFLYTSPFNKDFFPITGTYTVVLKVNNNVVTMTVNGRQYMSYTMSAKDVLSADGKYGFYTEDARVQVTNISAKQL